MAISKEEIDSNLERYTKLPTVSLKFFVEELQKQQYRLEFVKKIENEISKRKRLREKLGIKYQSYVFSFNLSLKQTKSIKTILSKRQVFDLIEYIAAVLSWDVGYTEEYNIIEARYRGRMSGSETEKMNVEIHEGHILIKSKVYEGLSIFSAGNNNLRINNFEKLFKELEQEFDVEYEEEETIEDEFKTLSSPPGELPKENIKGFYLTLTLFSIAYGVTLGFLEIMTIFYSIVLSILVRTTVFRVARRSNLVDFMCVQWTGRLMILSVLIVNQLTKFCIFTYNNIQDLNFLSYLEYRVNEGIYFSLIIWEVSGPWVIFLWVLEFSIVIVVYEFLLHVFTEGAYLWAKSIPDDVLEFIVVQVDKGKSKKEILEKLEKHGWKAGKYYKLLVNIIAERKKEQQKLVRNNI